MWFFGLNLGHPPWWVQVPGEEEELKAPVGPPRHPARTPPDLECATEKGSNVVLLSVGWMVSCKTSAQRSERKKKSSYSPPKRK